MSDEQPLDQEQINDRLQKIMNTIDELYHKECMTDEDYNIVYQILEDFPNKDKISQFNDVYRLEKAKKEEIKKLRKKTASMVETEFERFVAMLKTDTLYTHSFIIDIKEILLPELAYWVIKLCNNTDTIKYNITINEGFVNTEFKFTEVIDTKTK